MRLVPMPKRGIIMPCGGGGGGGGGGAEGMVTSAIVAGREAPGVVQ